MRQGTPAAPPGPSPVGGRRRAGVPAAILVVLGLGACGPPSEPRRGETPLATEEVPPPPDALVDVSRDPQEERRPRAELAGVLPGDFPPGLPPPRQATVADFGGASEGEAASWVAFLVPHPLPAVAAAYRERLEGAGWNVQGDASGPWELVSADRRRRALVELAREGPSTRVVVRYAAPARAPRAP